MGEIYLKNKSALYLEHSSKYDVCWALKPRKPYFVSLSCIHDKTKSDKLLMQEYSSTVPTKKKKKTKMQSMSKVQMHLNQWIRQYKKAQYLALHLHRKQQAVMVKNFFLGPNELWLSLTPNRIEKRA